VWEPIAHAGKEGASREEGGRGSAEDGLSLAGARRALDERHACREREREREVIQGLPVQTETAVKLAKHTSAARRPVREGRTSSRLISADLG